MALGGGQYDDLCTYVRQRAGADGALVMILGGCRGSGFSVQVSSQALTGLPTALRSVADQVQRDIDAMPRYTIICGACGERIPAAAAHVLPGDPPEARCARCVGRRRPRENARVVARLARV